MQLFVIDNQILRQKFTEGTVLVDRQNVIGRGGQLTNFNQIGTDQASLDLGAIVVTQQDNRLTDSQGKYFQLDSVISTNTGTRRIDHVRKKFNENTFENSLPAVSESEKLINSLTQKCQQLAVGITDQPMSSKREEYYRNQYSLQSRKEYKPENRQNTDSETGNTIINANLLIGPDGDATDVVSTGRGSSTSSHKTLALFDQNHSNLKRSQVDYTKITPILILNT